MKTEMKTEKFKKNGEDWTREIDTGIMYREEDIVHEVIDGKNHTIIFGIVDQKGFLKMLEAEGERV